MTIDHRQLRAFLAVADTGSLGRAAVQINLSQPALSRLIHDMETRLGVTLFDRGSNGMTLTVFGETLIPHARLLVFELGQAVDALDALRGLRRGTVRVGSVATIARSILPDVIDALLRSAPDLKVELLEAADDRLAAALTAKSIDLMIAGAMPPQDDIATIGEIRFGDHYAVFCASNHPLLDRDVVTLNDVLAERWIMPSRGATPRNLFEEAVRTAGGTLPRIAIETTSPSAIVSFVCRTAYLGWLPQPLFAGEKTAGTVRVLDIPALRITRRFFVYRRCLGLLPTAALRLLEELPLLPQANPSQASTSSQGELAKHES
jgi:DNA-binding transcriptional LysR family regulator